MNDNNTYFAARDSKDLASAALAKSKTFFDRLSSNSYLDKLKKMWYAYYGNYGEDATDGHRLEFTGEQGELVVLPVNHFRNLAQHTLNMITANRPIMEARAVNSDYKSAAQTILANGILDYYMREKNLELAIKRATEMAIVMGSGFIKMEWNATAGEAYSPDPETGEIDYEGEIEFTNLSPFDVIFDGTKEQFSKEWIITRSYQNKYNLAAKYPEFADKIKQLSSKNDDYIYIRSIWSNDETDDVPVYEFYHEKCEALPEGRYVLFLSEEIVLLDTPLVYKEVPIYRVVPSEIMGTPYGYSTMFDVYPIQEMINAAISALATNNAAFAVQNIWTPPGTDIAVAQLEGALNIIQSSVKPEPLNLLQSSPETYQFIQMLVQTAETLSGINSVARGNPEASLKSGAALALVQSMALQFISGLQYSYVKLIEETGSGLINILKQFATTPKTVALVGKNNRPLLKEFTSDSIGNINRVVVDVGNPLSRSTAGRVQMADQLLQMKLIKNPQQYFQVINTGRIENAYQGELNEVLLIQLENEELMEGKDPIVSPYDDHRLHISEHKAVLANPELRKDVRLSQMVMEHTQKHIEMLRNVDPDLLMILGQQPLNPPMAQTQELPPGPMSDGQGIPQKALQGNEIPGVMEQQSGLPQAQEAVQTVTSGQQSLPSMPQVDAGLLPNPELQAQNLGNVQ